MKLRRVIHVGSLHSLLAPPLVSCGFSSFVNKSWCRDLLTRQPRFKESACRLGKCCACGGDNFHNLWIFSSSTQSKRSCTLKIQTINKVPLILDRGQWNLVGPDLKFVKKFTQPNFQAKGFYTLKMRKLRLFSPAINSENASLSVI